ncbi:MAG: M15 family metallopeptidase [Thermodesulfobacteriota bacterium]
MLKAISPLVAGLLLLCSSLSHTAVIDPADSPGDNIALGFFEKVPLQETVSIDSQLYSVPESWLGYRLEAPPQTNLSLVMVPPEFAKDNGRIFLLTEACNAFQQMAEAAKEDGVTMLIDSGYRSLSYQKQVYKRLMAEDRSFTDIARYVAPPGYSEHMLGLAVDFVPSNWRFADSPVYQWLLTNGQRFGFSESYPRISSDKRPWEPSHWRYCPHIQARQKIRKIQ